MRILVFLRIISIASCCLTAASISAQGLANESAALDSVFMNDATNSVRVGRVVGVDAAQIRLEVPLASGGPGAKMSVGVARKDIRKIEFAANENRELLLADPAPGDIHEVGVLWKAWATVLDLPKSPAPRIANVYGNLLLGTNNPAQAAEALALFRLVEEKAWDESEKKIARQGRLRALVATGSAKDAIAEAEQLASESEDPAVLIEAKFILAEATRTSLIQLEADNPRWSEDIHVRPERHRLYNEALNLYLYPSLFFGSDVENASRGLWGAVQIYQINKDPAAAAEICQDLVKLYPQTSYARRAEEILAAMPKDSPTIELSNPNHEAPASDANSK
jgi:hypothetical protein